MTSIEVKRIGDGSVREFSNSEIGTGTLVNWVTENDPNADGLVRFINQANETGNATADSLSKFPKIVKDGSLVAGNAGKTVADWDGVNDGIELSPASEVDLQSNPQQTLSLKLEIEDPDNIPQHLARVNGINVYEEEGKIKVTIKDPDTDYRLDYLTRPRAVVNYKDSVYTSNNYDDDSKIIQRLNSSDKFETIDNSLNYFKNNSSGSGVTTYNDKLWGFQESPARETIYSFTGSKQIDGHFFRADGQKLYVTDLFPDTSVIEEYSLSNAWDVSTASKEASISKSNVNGVFFRPNGEKLYAISRSAKEIYEYTLSNPWNLNSAQLNAIISLPSTNHPRDLYFRDDGVKLYVGDPGTGDYNSGNVREYDLSTAWDISTLSLKQSGSIGQEGENDINGIYFKDDGTSLMIVGKSESEDYYRPHLWQYDLSTAWDITTASKTQDFPLNAYENLGSENEVGTLFFRSGEKFSVTKHNGEILEYKLYNSWNVRSSNYKRKNIVENEKSGLSAEYVTSSLKDCCFGDNGSQFYILDKRKVESYSLSSDYDLSSTERDGEIYLANRSFRSDALWVGSNRAYVAKDDDILEYILHEPWDISASEYNGRKDFAGSFDSLYFKPDGTKFFGINRSQRVVRELSLSTPWDITTGSQIGTYSPNPDPPSAEAQLQNLNGFDFAQGGDKLYLCDSYGSRAEYNLSTSWDLSTTSLQQVVDSRDVGPPNKGKSYQNLNPSSNTPSEFPIKGYVISPSGDKSYYFTPVDCFEYDFQSSFDISTENYNTTYGLTTGNFLLSCFFKYKNDLYAVYTDANGGGKGGILKYDGQTFNHFLTTGKMTQVFEEDVNARGLGVDPNGIAVFEDEIYFAPAESSNDAESKVLRYNFQDGWEQMFKFGPSTNTRTGVGIYGLITYDGDLWVSDAVGPLFRWNKKEEKFIRTNRYLATGQSQTVHTVYNKDLHLAESCDKVFKTDGLTYFEEDIDLDYNHSVLRVNGELWTMGERDNTSETGIIVKGKSVCITEDYNKQASEIEIKVGVTDRYLFTEINGQSTIKTHSLDYKNDGEIDLGLSLGSTNGDALAGVDEPYQGNISHLKWYPGITGDIFKKAESNFLDIKIDYTTDSSIEGVGSTGSKIEDIQKIEIKRADNQGGSFTTVDEINDPSSKEISFKDTGLIAGEEYYYKTVIIPSFKNVDSLESPVVSDIAEYPKPSAPEIIIRSTQPSEVSGEINSPDPEIFLDKFELYRSLNSGGSYNKVKEFTGVANSVTWIDSTVDPNKKYYYKAKAVKTDAPIKSDFSSKKSTAKIEETWEDYALEKTLSEISTLFNFTSGSDWYIDDEHSRVGSQSLRSEAISDYETTEVTIELSPNKRRQFYVRWGSDSNSYDNVYLIRDGNNIKNVSGENVGSRDVLSIPGGTTTNIKVSYQKNSTYKEFSDSGWIHHLIDAPVLPPEFTANIISTDKVEVNHTAPWNDVDGDFSGFHVYVDSSKVTNSPQPLDGTYTTSSLNAGNRTIKVTNVRADGVESSLKTKTLKIPIITDLTVSESSGDLQLTWNTNDPNSSYYNVYRADTRQGNYTKINSSNVTSESYTDSSAQSGEIYFYKVSSVDGSGNESFLSDYASNAFTVSDGETITLSDTEVSYVGFKVNGTLNIEGKVTLNIGSFFEVGSNGVINGKGNGFGPGSGNHADGNGPGGGFGQSGDGGIGASYGGQGGSAPDAYDTPPSPYGDPETSEIQQGSAGGNGDGNSVGGSGGAALEVLRSSGSFSTTIEGTLNFDGQNSQYDGSSFRGAGGGSGGGVFIESDITGSGTITAAGGDGDDASDSGGAGGGGRLKAYSFGSNITTDVSGGDPAGGSGNAGDPGTTAELTFKVPQNLDGSYDGDATEVNLSWFTNSSDVSHYNVYRADTSGGNFTEISSSDVTQMSYTDSSVSEDETYYYKVSSVLTGGTETNLSNEISVETVLLSLDTNYANSDTISLEIKSATSPDEIKVYRSEFDDAGPYSVINTISTPSSPVTYEDNSPLADKLNSYKVTQVENGTESSFTESQNNIASSLLHRADYENGLGEWVANEDAFVQKTNYSYEGSASAGIQEPGSDVDNVVLGYWEAGSAMQPEVWEFFWRENSNSSGGGLRLVNSNGNYEASFSTKNPQWTLSDGTSYNEEVKGDNNVYEEWIRVRFYFNWTSQEYDYEIKNMNSGTTRSGSGRSLENGLDVKRVNLEIYNDQWYETLPSSTGNRKTYWWQDSMYLGPDVFSNTNIIENSGGFTGTDVNLQGRQQETIRTFEVGGDEYQLAVYYDNNQNTRIARRKNRGSWTVTSLDNTVFNSNKSSDDHITAGLFKDQNDYIHIHGGIHSDDLASSNFYRRSASPLDSWDFQTTQGPPTFNIGTGTNSYTRPAIDNSGNIYITYRSGSPGNADQKFAEYDEAAEAWNPVTGFGSDGVLIKKGSTQPSDGELSIYMDHFPKFDSNGLMHVECTFRFDGGSRATNNDQAHLVFDLSNNKVKDVAGNTLADGSAVGYDDLTSEAKMEEATYASWNAFCGWQLDSNDNPVAVHNKPDGSGNTQYYLYSWDGSSWNTLQLTFQTETTDSLVDRSAPQLSIDGSDTAYITGIDPDESTGGLFLWTVPSPYNKFSKKVVSYAWLDPFVHASSQDDGKFTKDEILDIFAAPVTPQYEGWIGVFEDILS